MKQLIILLLAAHSFLALPLLAADIVEPDCDTIATWVDTLAPDLLSDRVARNQELEAYFTDESIEPVFGISYSVWNNQDKAAAKAIVTQCRADANANDDKVLSKKLIKIILYISK